MRALRWFPCLLPLLATTAWAQDARVVRTEHYAVHAEAAAEAAAEMGRVLEAGWRELAGHLGTEPKLPKGERLVVRFFRDRAGWARAIEKDGGDVPKSAGGLYWPPSRTAYLYRQPTRLFTRTLLLHEATHQFHYLARTRNRTPGATWYTEGVAEHLSWHFWDGKDLRMGVVPPVSLSDYPAKALAEVRADGFDLRAVVEAKTPASRPVAWALVRFLATGEDGAPLARYAAFARKLDAGGAPGPLFRKSFGRAEKIRARLVAWLERNQAPFAQVFNEWQGIGPGRFRGFAGVVSACRLKSPSVSLEATLEVPEDATGWKGGLLLNHSGPADYTTALLDATGTLQVARRVAKGWKVLARERVPALAGHGDFVLRATRGGDGVRVRVGEREYGPWKLPGTTLGLAVDASDLTYRDVRWTVPR